MDKFVPVKWTKKKKRQATWMEKLNVGFFGEHVPFHFDAIDQNKYVYS